MGGGRGEEWEDGWRKTRRRKEGTCSRVGNKKNKIERGKEGKRRTKALTWGIKWKT